MLYFQWGLWILGIALQILVISSLLRGLYRRFPFVLAYCTVTLLGTVGQIAARENPKLFARYYWVLETISQTLAFCIVIVLIYQVLGREHRVRVGRWLVAAAAAIAATSATLHRDDNLLSLWMSNLSRDLSFTAAILNLILWTILVASRRHGRLLLMVSGGLGIVLAGSAVGYALPVLNKEWVTVRLVGRMLVPLTYLLCLYVWWEAFRREDPEERPAGIAAKH